MDLIMKTDNKKEFQIILRRDRCHLNQLSAQ